MKWLFPKLRREVAADCIRILMANYTMPSYAAALMREKYGLDKAKTRIVNEPKFQYRVINSRLDYGGYLSFAEDVTNHSKDGWELVGGICVCLDQNGNQQFYQAMKKDNA